MLYVGLFNYICNNYYIIISYIIAIVNYHEIIHTIQVVLI